MTEDENRELVASVLALPRETEWVEFKVNNCDPREIGEYLSALANSAALHRKESGYIVWGVEDALGNPVVGTMFQPGGSKVGNEDLEAWLSRLLSPRINFQVHELAVEGKRVVIFCVQPATNQPVRFSGIEYVRIGSYKKPLKDFPEKERALWAVFSVIPFEKGVAAPGVLLDQVLKLIDYPSVFRLLAIPLPEKRSGVLDKLIQERLLVRRSGDRFDITNLGALLFASDLSQFDRVARKALRIIVYRGDNRIDTTREREEKCGYAVGFADAIRFVHEQLPENEQVGPALRKQVRLYPDIAIRELIANALMHQDFNLAGTGPMVEIFSGRMEISNPGTPLIDLLRFIDEPPQSRNESLAGFMRRMNICEERGSGIDKVVSSIEMYQLPAPRFVKTQDHTTVTLFAYRKLGGMTRDDRVRACYQHACLLYVSNNRMTNSTLRQRFGIAEKNYPMASKIIAETVAAGLIRPHDPKNTSKKLTSYVPFWS